MPLRGILSIGAGDPVALELRVSAKRLVSVAVFSGVVNLLTLSGSLYMLQVYDRVIPSRSIATLLGLSLIVLTAYAFQAYFDALRMRMLARVGALFDIGVQEAIFKALAILPLRGARPVLAQQPLRDLEQIRHFLSGIGPTALLDMPWIPIFVVALFLFHPIIGLTAACGAAAIIAMTLLSERHSKTATRLAMENSAQRQVLADATRQNAEVIHALGMTDRFNKRWTLANESFLKQNLSVMDLNANLGSVAKMLRYALQSAILGIGAYLVVIEQASGGIIIASSIMMGRALAPIEVALGSWKQFVAARQGVARLQEVLAATTEPEKPAVALPRPKTALHVEHLVIAPPATDRVVIANINFTLRAGMGMALLGASASGKSSLIKALVGIWRPTRGAVRLDGATLDQWRGADLGRHVGYLPQEVALFDGSVAENIARFDPDATPEAVLDAAKTAGAHDMILRLPQGYSTRIGEGGALLSAGQRQRVGLARAIFGGPFLIVLDEPNANLDADGESALKTAIETLRSRNCVVIVASHRPSALSALDMAMVLNGGGVVAFGPREEVFARAVRQGASNTLIAKVSNEDGAPRAAGNASQ